MPRLKATIFKLLVAISLLFTILPVMAAADNLIDATKAVAVLDCVKMT